MKILATGDVWRLSRARPQELHTFEDAVSESWQAAVAMAGQPGDEAWTHSLA